MPTKRFQSIPSPCRRARSGKLMARLRVLGLFGLLPLSLIQGVELDPRFFPDLAQHESETIYLRGVAALYPGKVLFEAPALPVRSLRMEAAKVEDLPQGIKYIRIYRLEEALPIIRELAEHPALILDFRYLKSPAPGTGLAVLRHATPPHTSLHSIGEIPAEIKAELETLSAPAAKRRHTTIVLCNRETAGPFEAMLARLQLQGAILVVGETTAGRTGFYKEAGSVPGAWILHGELRPEPDRSLVAVGLTPRITVALSPEANYRAYHLYEAGSPLPHLLRRNADEIEPDPEGDPDPAAVGPLDPVLQRGVEIVAALQILEHLPDS